MVLKGDGLISKPMMTEFIDMFMCRLALVSKWHNWNSIITFWTSRCLMWFQSMAYPGLQPLLLSSCLWPFVLVYWQLVWLRHMVHGILVGYKQAFSQLPRDMLHHSACGLSHLRCCPCYKAAPVTKWLLYVCCIFRLHFMTKGVYMYRCVYMYVFFSLIEGWTYIVYQILLHMGIKSKLKNKINGIDKLCGFNAIYIRKSHNYIYAVLIYKYGPTINTLRLRQNGCHFADNIYKCIFLNEKFKFWSKFHCILFLRAHLTIFQHWFR